MGRHQRSVPCSGSIASGRRQQCQHGCVLLIQWSRSPILNWKLLEGMFVICFIPFFLVFFQSLPTGLYAAPLYRLRDFCRQKGRQVELRIVFWAVQNDASAVGSFGGNVNPLAMVIVLECMKGHFLVSVEADDPNFYTSLLSIYLMLEWPSNVFIQFAVLKAKYMFCFVFSTLPFHADSRRTGSSSCASERINPSGANASVELWNLFGTVEVQRRATWKKDSQGHGAGTRYQRKTCQAAERARSGRRWSQLNWRVFLKSLTSEAAEAIRLAKADSKRSGS